MNIGFARTNDNNNLYLKTDKNNEVLLSEIFVDDIIFGGKEALYKSFEDEMKKEFEMSMFGEIKFFTHLQVHQTKDGIYITQSKSIKGILNTFGMDKSSPFGTQMVTR